MCNHKYLERVERQYYDQWLECIVEVRNQRCIFVEKPRLIKPTYPQYQTRPSIHVVKLYGLQAKHLCLKKIWEIDKQSQKNRRKYKYEKIQ